MSEKLKVHLNNTYDNSYKLVSTGEIWDGNTLVSSWTTNDPQALLHQGIEASEPNVFSQVKMKQILEKAAQLFEPTTITIEGK